MQNTTVLLSTPEDLEKLYADPGGSYALIADIDLENARWRPLNFSGTLTGNGHTVRNLKITEQGGVAGFFGVNTGTVQCLRLENVEMDLQGGVTAGGIVGENLGDISAVELTSGTLRLCCDENTAYIGAVAGINRGMLRNCVSALSLHMRCHGGCLYTGGLVGAALSGLAETLENTGEITADGENICIGVYAGLAENACLSALRFSSPMNLHNGALYSDLCGKKDETVRLDSCIWRDNRNSDRLLTPGNRKVRAFAADHLREMGRVDWSPDRELHYVCSCGGKVHDQDFYPGTVYHGVPYTHKTRCFAQFQDCFQENGKLQPWLKANGSDGFDLYMGCDCAGAVYLAWSRISPEMGFRWTLDMRPYKENGIEPLGDYVWNSEEDTTENMVLNNGLCRIAEAYAQMHIGDVFLKSMRSGHVRMCAGNPVIYRSPDGNVDWCASYVYTHEQGDGLWARNRHMHTSWLIDYRYTLLEMLLDRYVPITIPALSAEEIPPAQVAYEGESRPFTGTVSANYRIYRTTVEITEVGGAPVWKKSLYTAQNGWGEERTDWLSRTHIRQVSLSDYLPYRYDCHLEPGKRYHCRVCALLANEQEPTVTEFDFDNME